MDNEAKNYNASAEKDDGSCEYEEDNSDDGSGFGTLLTVGGIGAGAYYLKKRKSSSYLSCGSFFFVKLVFIRR